MKKSKLLRLLAVSSTLLLHFLAVSVVCEEEASSPAEEPSPAPPPPDPAAEPSPADAPPPTNEEKPDAPPPLSEEAVKKIFQLLQQGIRGRNTSEGGGAAKVPLSGRSMTGKSLSRRTLPANWASSRYSPAVCGGTYNVGKAGFVRFDLSSNSDCYLGFLGSRADRCTVNVLCDGTVELQDGYGGGDCETSYFKVGDGTIGLSESCGQFSFNGRPLTSLNKGRDLYVMYRGHSLDSPCVAFCAEDLTTSRARVGNPTTLSRSNFFKGFPGEGEGNCECGVRKDVGRVVGGTSALKFEFPWIAGLMYKNFEDYKRVPFCDGSLISDSHVLTAAHCFDAPEGDPPTLAQDIEVLLHAHVMDPTPNYGQFNEAEAARSPGWNMPKATDKTENSIRVSVAEIVRHPFYNPENFDYDVAILRLTRKVNLGGKKVTPICLPYLNERFDFEDSENMVVAGWGVGSEKAKFSVRLLQKLDLPFVNLATCMNYNSVTRRHLCAGYRQGGKDACQGDSGGPLIYNFDPQNRQYLLSGIVSAGVGCARRGKLGMYTDVQEIIQWVYHHTVDDETLWCSR